MATYNKDLALDRLQRNRINIKGNLIEPSKTRTGIKVWGAIDYLVKNHSFICITKE